MLTEFPRRSSNRVSRAHDAISAFWMNDNGENCPGLKLALNGRLVALVKLADYKDHSMAGIALLATFTNQGKIIF